jgi:two-component system LytT family response regulator
VAGKVQATPLKAVIVDDEALARGYLREMLGAHPEIEIVAECANGFEAVKAIGETAPDLVFLDVQMPKLDGFEVLELIDPGPAVVFVTAYDEYAMRAFDAHAVDYLLKPFGADRFERALERARARLGEKAPAVSRPVEQKVDRMVVRDGARVHVIPLEKLDYVEAQDDYIALHSGGKSYLKPQPIAEIERRIGLIPVSPERRACARIGEAKRRPCLSSTCIATRITRCSTALAISTS